MPCIASQDGPEAFVATKHAPLQHTHSCGFGRYVYDVCTALVPELNIVSYPPCHGPRSSLKINCLARAGLRRGRWFRCGGVRRDRRGIHGAPSRLGSLRGDGESSTRCMTVKFTVNIVGILKRATVGRNEWPYVDRLCRLCVKSVVCPPKTVDL